MPRINPEENMRAQPDSATLMELRIVVRPELALALEPLIAAQLQSLQGEVEKLAPLKGNRTERQLAWLNTLSARDIRRLKYHAMLNIGYRKQAREHLLKQYELEHPPRARGRPVGTLGVTRLRAMALGNVLNQLLHAVPRAALKRAVHRSQHATER